MEQSPVFRDGLYPKLLIESLSEMRQSGVLCDVILICGGEIPAHRVILSAASPYFRGMFSLGLKESKEERIEIKCMDGVVLQAAVDYMYCGELKATDDLLLPLMDASSFLQLGSLRSACMHRLVKSATAYSTLESYGSLSNKLGLIELGNFIHRLTIENFETVAFGEHKQKWLNASIEDISPLLHHFSIYSLPVTRVLKAVLEWVLHDEAGSRENHLKTLLSAFKNISKSDLDSGIRDLLIHKPHIYDWLLSCCQQSDPIGKILSIKETRVVVVIGGLAKNSAMGTAECYMTDSPTSSAWTLYLPDNVHTHPESGSLLRTSVGDRAVPQMNFARVYAASAFLDQEIYVIGGESGRYPVKTEASVECYNIALNRWSNVPGIPLPKDLLEVNEGSLEEDYLRLVGAAAAFVEGDLYVCGGKLEVIKYGNKEVYFLPSKWMVPLGLSSSTWVFNKAKNRWRKCSPMLQARAYHGAASVNGVLYAVGGIGATSEGHFTECLDSVEHFDPWSGVWRNVKPMPSPRAYFGCMTFYQYIYVVGGHNLENCKDTVFKYDTISDTWHGIEHPLRTPVDSLAACSLKYPLDTTRSSQVHSYILGGRNSHTGIRDANVYNFTTNRWHCLQSLIYGRIGASAGILRLLINDPASL